jgi:predicted SprT family Zn-dependent metalloprotease
MNFNETVHVELNKLFKKINSRFYDNELIEPNILIQSVGTKKWYGYCTTKKVWEVKGEEVYEIALSAEYLNRSFEEVVATLMHEMVHLYNLAHDVRDVSGTQYHNKRFKNEAEKRGLNITYAKVIGWSSTTLNDEAKDWIATLEVNREAFDAVRKVPVKTKKKAQKTYTYTCPICNEKILSKNPDLEVECVNCGELFERRMK